MYVSSIVVLICSGDRSANWSALSLSVIRSWLRTMDLSKPPSELVVAYVLRDSLFDFIAVLAKTPLMRKIMVKYWKRDCTLTYKDVA